MARNGRQRLAVRLVTEFGTIVVGVLVALWLGGWATERDNRALEVQYLQSLITDISRDSALVVDQHIPAAVRARTFLEAVLPISMGSAPLPADTLAFLRQMSTSHIFPIVEESGPTHAELVATGSLRLLESGAVRSAVVDYYRFKLLVRNRIQLWESGYPQLIRSYLPQGMGLQSDMWLGASRDAQVLPPPETRRAIAAVRTEEFMSAAYRHLNYLGGASPTFREWLSQAQFALEVLRDELERLE